MPLIQNLLYRESDRAYFHVDNRLRTCPGYQEQQAKEEWGVEPACDAKQLLCNNLRSAVGSRGEPNNFQPVYEHETTFLLPCGHEQNVVIEQLRSMSVLGAIRFTCGHCGEKVMQAEDRFRLRLWRDRKRRAAVCEEEQIWQRLERTFPLGPQPVNVATGILLEAVNHAFQSLWVPSSASPLALQMPSREHFSDIRNRFCGELPQHDFTEM